MLNIKLKFLTRIAFVLIFSYFMAGLLNNELFINDSPLVRKNLSGYISWRVGSMVFEGKKTIANLIIPSKRETSKERNEAEKVIVAAMEKVKDKPMIPVSKGVYAQTDGETVVKTVMIDEVEMIEHTFVIDGETIKIRVPAGVSSTDIEKTLKNSEPVTQ